MGFGGGPTKQPFLDEFAVPTLAFLAAPNRASGRDYERLSCPPRSAIRPGLEFTISGYAANGSSCSSHAVFPVWRPRTKPFSFSARSPGRPKFISRWRPRIASISTVLAMRGWRNRPMWTTAGFRPVKWRNGWRDQSINMVASSMDWSHRTRSIAEGLSMPAFAALGITVVLYILQRRDGGIWVRSIAVRHLRARLHCCPGFLRGMACGKVCRGRGSHSRRRGGGKREPPRDFGRRCKTHRSRRFIRAAVCLVIDNRNRRYAALVAH